MGKKITMKNLQEKTFRDVYDDFVIAKKARGVTEYTIRNYRHHFKSIEKYIDVDMPFRELTKSKIDEMIIEMRQSNLAHNSIATYVRNLKTFLNWCNAEGLSKLKIDGIKEKETVKDTYTDEELELLLEKPCKNCSFTEYRNWVIVNFLLNSGCRAASVRNIQIRDLDLNRKQVILRHNKNGKINVIPLCSIMVSILSDYLRIREGKEDDYLFCSQYGEMLTENALRLAIAKYNTNRGVSKTSIHLFRHTFARKYLVDCGGNAFTLQHLLGHSTLDMTKHYCKIFDADISKSYDSFSPLANMTQKKETIKMKRR